MANKGSSKPRSIDLKCLLTVSKAPPKLAARYQGLRSAQDILVDYSSAAGDLETQLDVLNSKLQAISPSSCYKIVYILSAEAAAPNTKVVLSPQMLASLARPNSSLVAEFRWLGKHARIESVEPVPFPLEIFAKLRIAGVKLVPAVVSTALELSPTEEWQAGDARDGDNGDFFPFGCWQYSTETISKLAGSDLDAHLKHLFLALKPKELNLITLVQADTSAAIVVFWDAGNWETLQEISFESLRDLARLGLPLILDVYF